MIPSRSQFFFQIKKPRFVVPSKLRVMNQIFVLRFVVVCLRLLVEKKKKREKKMARNEIRISCRRKGNECENCWNSRKGLIR